MLKQSASLLLCLTALFHAAPVPSQQYPSRPIRIIVAQPPGGSTDLVARAISDKLSGRLKQQVILDNRPSRIAIELAERSAPDGHTLLAQSGGLESRDLVQIATIGTQSSFVVVPASSPAKSMKDLIALARAKPGELPFATAGIGSASWRGMSLLERATGAQFIGVPYKGTTPSVIATVSGEAMVSLAPMPAISGHIQGGRLRALAVTSSTRSPFAPEIPTISETLNLTFSFVTRHALLVPSRTPATILALLNGEIAGVQSDPDVRQRLRALSVDSDAAKVEVAGRQPRCEPDEQYCKCDGCIPKDKKCSTSTC